MNQVSQNENLWQKLELDIYPSWHRNSSLKHWWEFKTLPQTSEHPPLDVSLSSPTSWLLKMECHTFYDASIQVMNYNNQLTNFYPKLWQPRRASISKFSPYLYGYQSMSSVKLFFHLVVKSNSLFYNHSPNFLNHRASNPGDTTNLWSTSYF